MIGDAWLRSLVAAALASALAGFAVRRFAPRLGALDHPDGHLKTHAVPVPVLGGVALAAGVVAGLGAAGTAWGAGVAWLAPAAAFLTLGAIDDRVPLGPAVKLAAGAAIVLAWLAVARPLAEPTWIEVCVVAVLILTLANAANLVDVADALCAGLVAVSSLALAVLLLRHGDSSAATAAAALAGAALGFLWHNRPPARLYLGDGGSLFAGFALGYLVLRADVVLAAGSPAARTAPLLLVGVLLFETVLLSVLRIARGQSPLRGSPDHLVHQLRRLGVGAAASVSILIGVGAALAAAGLALGDAW